MRVPGDMKVVWLLEGELSPSSAYSQQLYLFADRLHPFGVESVVANPISFKEQGDAVMESIRLTDPDVIIAFGNSHPWPMAEHLGIPMLSWFLWGDTRPLSFDPFPLVTFAPVSVDTKKKFSAEFPSVRYVPHGFDAGVFHPGRQRSARARVEWNHDRPVVMTIGTNLVQPQTELGPDRKNWGGILGAFATTLEQIPDALLYVHSTAQGSVDIPQVVAELGIQDSVVLGDQSRFTAKERDFTPNDIADLYRASDVLLMPSLGEGFGIPLIEAQACGIPVVTTEAGPMTELTYTGTAVAGSPHPARLDWTLPDQDAVAKAVVEWIRTPVDRVAVADKVQGFTAEAIVEDFFFPALEECAALAPRTVSHIETVPELKDLKIDVGSGGPGMWQKTDGSHITIDKFVGADVQADMWSIPFPDGSVEELWSSHALEHIPRAQVEPTLAEWFRLLKSGGTGTLIVPNFDYIAQAWLDTKGEGSYIQDIVWGSQLHEGEFHKVGFNPTTLVKAVEQAGFLVTGSRVEFAGVYSQESVIVEFAKP